MAKIKSGPDTEKMLAAAESGQQSLARGYAASREQRNRGIEDASQAGRDVSQMVLAGREDIRRQQEHEQVVGTKDKPGLREREMGLQERAQTFREQQAEAENRLNEEKLDIEAANRGLERTSPRGGKSADQRKADVEAGMAQGTAGDQRQGPGLGPLQPDERQRLAGVTGQQGLELDSPTSTYRMTPQAQEFKKQQLETQRLNAQAAEMNARANYLAAQRKGDVEGQEKAAEAIVGSIKKTQDLLTDVQTNKVHWESLKDSFPDNPGVEGAQWNKQTVMRMLRAKLDHQNISYMAMTGAQPVDYDPSSPMMKRFNSRFNEVAAMFRGYADLSASPQSFQDAMGRQDAVGAMQTWQGIRDYGERNNFLRKLTAQVMMEEDEIRRRSTVQAQASGVFDQLGQANQELARLQEENRMLREQSRGGQYRRDGGAAGGGAGTGEAGASAPARTRREVGPGAR